MNITASKNITLANTTAASRSRLGATPAAPPPERVWVPLEGPPPNVEALVILRSTMYVDAQGRRYEVSTFVDPEGNYFRLSNEGGGRQWFALVERSEG
jgi:hypothetical protein